MRPCFCYRKYGTYMYMHGPVDEDSHSVTPVTKTTNLVTLSVVQWTDNSITVHQRVEASRCIRPTDADFGRLRRIRSLYMWCESCIAVDLSGVRMNRDRLRRRVRPTTSCPVAQKSTSLSSAVESGTSLSSSSCVTDHGVRRSLSLPAVVSSPVTVSFSC